MAIVKMKKLRVIALRQQRDDLMRQLLRLGCVEVQEPEGMLSDPGRGGAGHPDLRHRPLRRQFRHGPAR